MKKKLFYLLGIVFFATTVLAEGRNVSKLKLLSPKDKARIAAIEKHNEEQEQNLVFLADYHAQNPVDAESKSEAYWDLAWHARLADYGDAESQFITAQAYEKGDVIEANPKKALAFYQKSADNGYIDACLRLAEIYRENKMVRADPEKEIYWYEKAAVLGHIQAQIKVSDLYQSGDNPDYKKSYDWLKIALQQLFPQDPDVEKHSPELQRLKGLFEQEPADE